MKNKSYESSHATKQANLRRAQGADGPEAAGTHHREWRSWIDAGWCGSIFTIILKISMISCAGCSRRRPFPCSSGRRGALLWQEGLLQLFQYLQENRAVVPVRPALFEPHTSQALFPYRFICYRGAHCRGHCRRSGLHGRGRAGTAHAFCDPLRSRRVMESWLLGEIDRTPEELIAFADPDPAQSGGAARRRPARRKRPKRRKSPAELDNRAGARYK